MTTTTSALANRHYDYPTTTATSLTLTAPLINIAALFAELADPYQHYSHLAQAFIICQLFREFVTTMSISTTSITLTLVTR